MGKAQSVYLSDSTREALVRLAERAKKTDPLHRDTTVGQVIALAIKSYIGKEGPK